MKFIPHILSILDQELASTFGLFSLSFKIVLVYRRLRFSIQYEMSRHWNVVIFQFLIYLPSIPEIFLSLKVINLNRLLSVHVLKGLFHREARRVKTNEDFNFGPFCDWHIHNKILTKFNDFKLFIFSKIFDDALHRL
jgi:hypothetical protein